MKYSITPRYLTKVSKRRSGISISPAVKFIVAHDTGNPNSTADGNVRYYERTRDETSASAHLFVDDREILECIPAIAGSPPEKAWHVLYSVAADDQLFGYNANDAALGVEYCYGDRINAEEAYRKYLWVIAYACFKYGLDPSKYVVGHFFLDPQRRTDPVTGLSHSRRTYDQFLHDVVVEYYECAGQLPATSPPPVQRIVENGTVITTVRLNIRKGSPSTRGNIHQTVPRGTNLSYVAKIKNGQPVNANSIWFEDANGNFFWSGGTIPFYP